MNKYSSYRSEMVSTDGRTDTEGYNIIPRHTLVAGYNNNDDADGDMIPVSTMLPRRHKKQSKGHNSETNKMESNRYCM